MSDSRPRDVFSWLRFEEEAHGSPSTLVSKMDKMRTTIKDIDNGDAVLGFAFGR